MHYSQIVKNQEHILAESSISKAPFRKIIDAEIVGCLVEKDVKEMKNSLMPNHAKIIFTNLHELRAHDTRKWSDVQKATHISGTVELFVMASFLACSSSQSFHAFSVDVSCLAASRIFTGSSPMNPNCIANLSRTVESNSFSRYFIYPER